MLAAGTQMTARAVTLTQSGQVSLSGVMPNPPPAAPAIILEPANGFATSEPTVTIRGTCPSYATMVQIYRNGTFAGSTICQDDIFSLEIALYSGSNTIMAKAIDSFSQSAPDSELHTIIYTPRSSVGEPEGKPRRLPAPSSSEQAGELLLTSDKSYVGGVSGRSVELSLVVSGGRAPYALIIKWGDTKQDVLTQANSGVVKAYHTYASGGLHTVKVEIVDNAGTRALLQMVVVVQGPVAPLAGSARSSNGKETPQQPYVRPSLEVVWPFYLLLLAFVLTFWLGVVVPEGGYVAGDVNNSSNNISVFKLPAT
jgi:hypothetical protein